MQTNNIKIRTNSSSHHGNDDNNNDDDTDIDTDTINTSTKIISDSNGSIANSNNQSSGRKESGGDRTRINAGDEEVEKEGAEEAGTRKERDTSSEITRDSLSRDLIGEHHSETTCGSLFELFFRHFQALLSEGSATF